MPRATKQNQKKIRYAAVGLGHIAQVAVLPAFAHAGNSELAALVSDDPEKLQKLGRRYKVKGRFSYDQFEEGLRSEAIDAVYIALPNHLHRPYAERAARAGVHVLCEKPMAVTEEDCLSMIRVAEEYGVKLMVGYRLHFEEANLKAIDLVQGGKLGDARLFNSVFTMQVKEGDIRLSPRELGGGTLYDIGIYCINAARNLYGAEPMEVIAFSANIEGLEVPFQHRVDGSGNIMGCSDLSQLRTSLRSFAPIKCPKGAMGTSKRRRRLAKSLSGALGRWQGSSAKDFPSRNSVMRSQA